MKYLSAYALAWLATEKEPTVNDLKKIIESVGGEFDQARAQNVVDKLKGQNLCDVIKAGLPKLQSISASSGASSGPTGGATETKAEEAKKEEEDDEDAMEGGMNLFGEDDDW